MAIPITMHFAVISPKQLTPSPISERFFRSQENARGQDFNNGLTGIQFDCLPINTDLYDVLMHKRRTVNPSTGGFGFVPNSGKNYGTLQKYIKIKRQVAYDTEGNTTNGQLLLVIWCDQMFTSVGQPSVNNAMRIAEHHVAYFKEPCC
jgi:hypothetical protein